jgi:hypothetical protein
MRAIDSWRISSIVTPRLLMPESVVAIVLVWDTADTGRRSHQLDRLDPGLSGPARQRARVRFPPMSFKRRGRLALGKNILLETGHGLELDVTTRMGVEELRDALANVFLLELNQLVAEDEQHGRKVRGPGLPDHLDPKDSRWFSTDCIDPPPVES